MHPIRRTLFPVIAGVLLLAAEAHAVSVSVSAQLSRPQVNFGEMAELQVTVSGAQRADVPQDINADGLQIRLSGQSTQVQMVNFKVSSSAVYTYVVLPLKTGNFTIPSVTVTADGQQFRTPSVRFSVVDAIATGTVAPGGVAPAAPSPAMLMPPQGPSQGLPMPGFQQRPRQAAPQSGGGRLAFGEISCSKKDVYAGEMVPVEIRFYFDARYPVQVRGKVDFGSEGVVIERFSDPKESLEERDGLTYNVLTFRTLLSAVKPGTIDIPSAKLDSQIQLPGAVPAGFDDPIFRQLLGGQSPFAQNKEVKVQTAPLHLEVLPLPKEGRPASFAGAVGQFDLDALVQNPKPAPGDPVTFTLKIGGKGNFNGMGAPVLTETAGWRSYPPTDKFDNSGSAAGLAYSGVKSFDFTLIAQEAKQSSPGSEFSYFDPTSAKYVTLTTKPLPLDASPGSAASAASTGASSTASPSTQPAPSSGASSEKASPVKDGDPIPGITLHSWSTPLHRAEFLVATLAMLVATAALAGVLYLRDLQARGGTAASRRRRKLTELWSSLHAETLEAASTYDAAIEYAGLVALPSEKRDALIASLSARRDVVKYGSGGSLPVPSSEREQLLQTLKELSNKTAR